jgi:hypothetical protein
MFESSILTVLKADTALAAMVSTVASSPAIFSGQAPEDTPFPYIVFDINGYDGGSLAVDRFTVSLNYFDQSTSSKKAREAVQRIISLLDYTTLSHTQYNAIRLFRSSFGPVAMDDPRDIQYNIIFDARAGRKKWITEKTS